MQFFLSNQILQNLITFAYKKFCQQGILSPDQGAKAPVYLATLPQNTQQPRGEFIWHDTTPVDWEAGPMPPPGY